MNKRTALLLLAVAGASALLMACSMPMNAPVGSSPVAAQSLRVTGTVAYRERMALPPTAEIIVRLQDVSRMDAPAVVLAEQRIRADGRQVPFAFDLGVDPARIDPRMRYTVSARIVQGEELMFISDTAYPVLTQGQGAKVDLMLVRARPAPR
jgi:putative lipoprotein